MKNVCEDHLESNATRNSYVEKDTCNILVDLNFRLLLKKQGLLLQLESSLGRLVDLQIELVVTQYGLPRFLVGFVR